MSKKVIKSFNELGEVLKKENFELCLNDVEYRKKYFINKNISFEKMYLGIYKKDTNTVLIDAGKNHIRNPFTNKEIEAKLQDDKVFFKDGEKIKVLLVRNMSEDIKPETFFECISYEKAKKNYNIIKGENIYKSITDTDIVLITNCYIQSREVKDKKKINALIKKYNRLLRVNEAEFKEIYFKCGEIIDVIDKESSPKKISGKQNKVIAKTYRIYLKDKEEFKTFVRDNINVKERERGYDIIQKEDLSKNKTYNTSKMFRLELGSLAIDKATTDKRLYVMPTYNDGKLKNAEQINFIRKAPHGSFCIVYHNGKQAMVVKITDNLVSIHRNGCRSRCIKIINYGDGISDQETKKEKTKKKGQFLYEKDMNIEKKTEKMSRYITVDKPTISIDAMSSSKEVKELKTIKNRIKFTNVIGLNVFECYSKAGAIRSIQLVKGMRNHVTMNHTITNKAANLVVYNEASKHFMCVEMLLHYCEDCNQYFDFYDSFCRQLSIAKIKKSSIMTKLVDDYLDDIIFDTYEFREQSKLHLYGYRAGRSGLSKEERETLIKKLIINDYMSAAEIKNHLQFLIRFHGKSHQFVYAKECWESDIDYINNLVRAL